MVALADGVVIDRLDGRTWTEPENDRVGTEARAGRPCCACVAWVAVISQRPRFPGAAVPRSELALDGSAVEAAASLGRRARAPAAATRVRRLTARASRPRSPGAAVARSELALDATVEAAAALGRPALGTWSPAAPTGARRLPARAPAASPRGMLSGARVPWGAGRAARVRALARCITPFESRKGLMAGANCNLIPKAAPTSPH